MAKIKTNVLKILLIVLGLVLTSSFFYSSSLIVGADTVGGSNGDYVNYNDLKDNVSYSKMDITLDIRDDGSMKFTYDFDVCANTSSITEFYFIFPYIEYMYRDINGDGLSECERYYAKISNEQLAKGQSGNEILKRYVDDVEKNYLTIGIKNPTGYYKVGDVRNYEVSFDYDMTFNYQDGYDEIYINLLGGTYLKLSNVSFTINLPKDVNFNEYKPYIYTGRMASAGTFDDIELTNGNKISSTRSFDVNSGSALTYRQLLPEGYFKDSNKQGSLWIVLTVCFSLIAGGGLIFLKNKSKPDKMAIPVQLEMPNMLPTDAEVFYSHKITKKSLGATIIYLANLGYIKIETKGEKCEPEKLIKVKDLPNDFDGNIKTIFNRVFKNDKNEVYLDDLGSLTLYERMTEFKKTKESEFKTVGFTSDSKKRYIWIQVLDIVCSLVPLLFFFLQVKTSLGFIPQLFVSIFLPIVAGGILFACQEMKEGPKVMLFIFSAILSFATVSLMLNLDIFNSCIYAVVFYMLIVIIGFIPAYKHYSKEVIEDIRLIRGVKNYIEKVEKNRIEKLVMENPSVYYDILPFAYVLGVSDKWINAFEGVVIAPPAWLVGNDTVYVSFHTRQISAVCNGINRNMSSFVNSSRAQKFANSRSSWSSGSGSSGGGGGFSGGGGGGASFGGR